jgi:hypothetical protein
MGPSSGTLDLTIIYLSFCYSPYTGQCLQIGSALYIWFYVVLYPICTTNCVDGNNNKTMSYTQYDAEVQHF